MNNYLFQSKPSVEDIKDKLIQYGIALIPNYMEKNIIKNLKSNFDNLINQNGFKCIINRTGHPTNSDGVQVLLDPKLASNEGMVEFEEVFHSKFIYEIASSYFSPNKFDLNPRILLNHLKPSPVQILPWHFDRIQTLKFWVYVKDTYTKDGAFEYCLGSHWEGRYRAGYHMATGESVIDIPNDIPSYRVQNPVSVEAKAGDLIIFDPDGFHRGGIVAPDHERCVIRADTFPIPSRKYNDKFLSSGWWLRSRFNLGKIFKNSASRILGDQIKDITINRESNEIKEKKN